MNRGRALLQGRKDRPSREVVDSVEQVLKSRRAARAQPPPEREVGGGSESEFPHPQACTRRERVLGEPCPDLRIGPPFPLSEPKCPGRSGTSRGPGEKPVEPSGAMGRELGDVAVRVLVKSCRRMIVQSTQGGKARHEVRILIALARAGPRDAIVSEHDRTKVPSRSVACKRAVEAPKGTFVPSRGNPGGTLVPEEIGEQRSPSSAERAKVNKPGGVGPYR